jgi:hypothetical protein
MEWDAIAAIGGLLGAVGVMLTVVFLAIQVRRNTAVAQSQAYQTACDALAEFAALIGQDAAISRFWRIGLSNPDVLEDNQSYQFALLGTSLLRRYENIFYHYQAGLIGDDSWAVHRNNVLWFSHRPGVQRWWKERRQTFSSAFRQYLESSAPDDAQTPAERSF